MSCATFAFGSTRFCMPHMRKDAERTVVTIRYPGDAERHGTPLNTSEPGSIVARVQDHAGRE